jgi:hypothetical protein
VVPADNKDFAHLVVAAAMIEALEGMELKEPTVSDAERDMLGKARAELEAE